MCVYIYIIKSFFCIAETNTILLINYTSIKKEKRLPHLKEVVLAVGILSKI